MDFAGVSDGGMGTVVNEEVLYWMPRSSQSIWNCFTRGKSANLWVLDKRLRDALLIGNRI